MWFAYNQQVQFHAKWYWQNEIQERVFISPFKQHQFLLRTHVHYLPVQQIDMSVGFCYFLQDNHDPYKEDKLSVPELRPHAEVIFKMPIHKIQIDHRIRFELRYFHNTTASQNDLTPGYHFGNYRFRYQLQVQIPLVKIADKQYLKLRIADEILINAGKNIKKNIFDQNRIYAALACDISPSLNFELGYLNWYQQRNNGTDYYNRSIIRVIINHKINAIRKEKH